MRRRTFADVYSNKWCSHVQHVCRSAYGSTARRKKPLASPTSLTLNDFISWEEGSKSIELNCACTVQTPVYSALVYSILEVYLCLLYGADTAEFALSLLASPLMSEHCLWRTKDTTKKDCSATFTQQAAVTCQFRRATAQKFLTPLINKDSGKDNAFKL